MKLDRIDLKILELITTNPEICQEEIAREVGITQPAVCVRLKKLKKYGIMKKACGVNIKAINLMVIFAEGEANLEELEENPYFLCGFEINRKVIAFFAAENYETAESCARVMFKKIERVVRVENFEGVLGLQVRRGKCAKPCEECEFYEKTCVGLPWSRWYVGKIFRSPLGAP